MVLTSSEYSMKLEKQYVFKYLKSVAKAFDEIIEKEIVVFREGTEISEIDKMVMLCAPPLLAFIDESTGENEAYLEYAGNHYKIHMKKWKLHGNVFVHQFYVDKLSYERSRPKMQEKIMRKSGKEIEFYQESLDDLFIKLMSGVEPLLHGLQGVGEVTDENPLFVFLSDYSIACWGDSEEKSIVEIYRNQN